LLQHVGVSQEFYCGIGLIAVMSVVASSGLPIVISDQVSCFSRFRPELLNDEDAVQVPRWIPDCRI
jgi:hypothetical protein